MKATQQVPAEQLAYLQARQQVLLQQQRDAARQRAENAEIGGEESAPEALSKEVFTPYHCRSLDRGLPHCGDIAEAASLAAIDLPAATYPLWDALPRELIESGQLSALQLEGVLYACQRHCEILPSGERAGFFIGDGAGVGKGRQLAGILLDNLARGRRKHVWVSISNDLHLDAERDLRDIGCRGFSSCFVCPCPRPPLTRASPPLQMYTLSTTCSSWTRRPGPSASPNSSKRGCSS